MTTRDLTPKDIELLLVALDDAIAYREADTDGCVNCNTSVLCQDHVSDNAKAEAYQNLANRIEEGAKA